VLDKELFIFATATYGEQVNGICLTQPGGGLDNVAIGVLGVLKKDGMELKCGNTGSTWPIEARARLGIRPRIGSRRPTRTSRGHVYLPKANPRLEVTQFLIP
jgi:hypothetical protein